MATNYLSSGWLPSLLARFKCDVIYDRPPDFNSELVKLKPKETKTFNNFNDNSFDSVSHLCFTLETLSSIQHLASFIYYVTHLELFLLSHSLPVTLRSSKFNFFALTPIKALHNTRMTPHFIAQKISPGHSTPIEWKETSRPQITEIFN